MTSNAQSESRRRVEWPQSHCRCGVARGDITPPVGIYHRMWGAARHDRAEGVHRPLTATVLLFEPLETDALAARQVVVALDHCLLFPPEVAQLVAGAAEAGGVRRDEIRIVFSHTHAAGLMTRERADQPGGDQIGPYLDRLQTQVADLLAQARDGSRPARIGYAYGRCDLAAHRDYWDAELQQFVCGFNPDSPADDTLLAARIETEEGELLATVVNYACHPTTLAWQNRLISPDYPGAAREVVETQTGAPCLFVQGASGDLGPREGFCGDVQVADRNGRRLGYATLAALESIPSLATAYAYQGPVVSGATLGIWKSVPLDGQRSEQVKTFRRRNWSCLLRYRADLPSREQVQRELAAHRAAERVARDAGNLAEAAEQRAMVERSRRLAARLESLPSGTSYPYAMAAWRLGDAIWLAVPGEPYQLLQRTLRQRFAERPVMVATIADGWGPSYLPPADRYNRGIYQETVAVLAPRSLEQVIEEAERVIAELLA